MSEIEATMITALVKAQGELSQLTLKKTGQNPHFRNRYIPLEELIDEIVPVLNKHGFALVQKPSVHEGQPALMYELLHTSGGRIGGEMLLMSAKESPQDQGSAITYARRYSLMSLLGVAADPDDDGNAASRPPQRQDAAPAARTPQPPPPRAPAGPRNGSPPSSPQQQRAIHTMLGKLDEQYVAEFLSAHAPAEAFDAEGKFHTSQLTIGQASGLIDELNKSLRANAS